MIDEIIHDLCEEQDYPFETFENICKYMGIIEEANRLSQISLLDFLIHKITKEYEKESIVITDEGFHVCLDVLKLLRKKLKQ